MQLSSGFHVSFLSVLRWTWRRLEEYLEDMRLDLIVLPLFELNKGPTNFIAIFRELFICGFLKSNPIKDDARRD